MDPIYLGNVLSQTLQPSTHKQAEQQLQTLECQPEFADLLLNISTTSDMSVAVRLAAMLYLKNFIKKTWPQDEDTSAMSLSTRRQFRSRLIDSMLILPSSIQIHASEIISIISSFDFPDNWDDLLPQLVSKLTENDYHINNGVLMTAHAIFKKYRHEFRSNELFSEINMVLSQFADPLLNLYKATDKHIEIFSENKEALSILFNSLFLLNKIFYSLSSQDIPAFFEDHLKEFSDILLKYISYHNGLLVTDNTEESGLLEKVQTSVCEIAHLYAQKYEEEFLMLPQFIERILNLLASTSLAPKYDLLISMALGVVTVVAKRPLYSYFFESTETLKVIAEKIIFPNIQMRESDELQFDNEPLDVVRLDMEGSETEFRKKASEDLIRSLVQLHNSKMLPILSHYISSCVHEYHISPKSNWKKKSAAIYVFMAMAASSSTLSKGATSVRDGVDVLAFLEQYILPDLQGSISAMQSMHPVLLTDAIKFCMLFRNQLPKDQLRKLMPLATQLLNHSNEAVYSYAVIFIDRLLGMRLENGSFMLASTPQEMLTLCEPLCAKLLSLIKPEQRRGAPFPSRINENEFLLLTLLRVIFLLKESVTPLATLFFREFLVMVQIVAKNPTNPKFNHFLFEALAALTQFAFSTKSVDDQIVIEIAFVQAMQQVLGNDVTDFIPYVFLLASCMIEYSRIQSGISPHFSFLFEPLLQPALWLSPANVPSLVRLLEAFIAKNPMGIAANPAYIQAILGIFQNLLSSKVQDHFGFDLMRVCLIFWPLSVLEANGYLSSLLLKILQRAQTNKSPKFARCFFLFLTHFIVFAQTESAAKTLYSLLESVQPGLFGMVWTAYVLNAGSLLDSKEQKIVSIAYAKCLCLTEFVDNYSTLWVRLFEKLVSMQTNIPPQSHPQKFASEDDENDILDSDGVGPIVASSLSSGTSRLKAISSDFVHCKVQSLPDPQVCILESLNLLRSSRPNFMQNMLGDSAAPMTVEYLLLLSSKSGIPFI